MIIAFRRCPRRSSQAPACSANSRLGSQVSAVRNPISAASERSTRTAVSGSATDEIWSPNIDTVDAPQYRRKTRSRSNGGTRPPSPASEFIAIEA